jgi:hypothetical protein
MRSTIEEAFLSPLDFELLVHLMQNAPQVTSRWL